MKIHVNSMYRLVVISTLLLFYVFICPSQASQKKPLLTNVRNGQFTVTWKTDNSCKGKVRLYKHSRFLGDFYDDRGKDFNSTTHHVTVSKLKEDTAYAFAIESDGIVNDNEGLFYQLITGPPLIPMGSVQPAGRVLRADEHTPVVGSIVFITISCFDKNSATLSTLVDENGYWYIELVNAREDDYQKLYNISEKDCNLIISVEGEEDTAYLEAPLMDSQGGKKLYEALIIK